jgi:hypothetical protein
LNWPRLETIVKHDGRLNVLVNLLDSFSLVQRLGNLDDGEALYAVTLDEHPDWVREAVADHRPDQQSDSK